MDDVLCDFKGAFVRERKREPGIQWPQATYGFFANLLPIDGALEAMFVFKQTDRYDVHILTAPSVQNPLCYTEKRLWVEKHLGFDMVHKLIICPNKSLIIGDYLVDDNVTGKGQDGFKGELIHFGSNRFPDWVSVTKYLGV
jgi:5'(3')-deoxyribonucleotidase